MGCLRVERNPSLLEGLIMKKYTMNEFYNLPDKEKEKIILRAVRGANKDQRDFMNKEIDL